MIKKSYMLKEPPLQFSRTAKMNLDAGEKGTEVGQHGHNDGEAITLDEASKDRLISEAKTMADLINEESENIHRVFMIKVVIENYQDDQVTKIGMTVSDLQLHWSKKIVD